MYTCIKTEGTARRGVFETVHGTIQTPFFMNVGTGCGKSLFQFADVLHDVIQGT